MASLLLVPMMYFRPGGDEPARPEFALSDGPPATWLEADRVVAETVSTNRTPIAAPASSESGGGAGAGVGAVSAAGAPVTTARATTTSVPARGSTTTTARATTVAAPPTTTRVASTTTTVTVTLPLPPGSVAVAQRFGTHTDRGVASWFGAPAGTCAHRTIPFGTVVRVTRLHNGAVTTCVVDDWGPADTTRVIDLSTDTFEKLAYVEAGLIDVVIEW